MRRAQSKLNRQPARDLPGVLGKTFVGVVRNIVDAIKRSLLIPVQGAGDQIGISVAKRVRVTNVHQSKPVGVVISRLGVANSLPEEAGLEGVLANYLRD